MLKLSIVTLSFNQGAYLEQSINSVLSQSYTNWELIILDPGSSDASREIAQRYANLDPRIRLIFEKDDGPSDGLNKGLRISTGDIIGCLNSDDYYRPQIFDEVIKAFEKYTDFDCIYSHGFILKSGKLKFQSSDIFSNARYFSNRGLVLQQSTFFRSKSLESLQVNFNVQNRSSWDGEFIVELYSKGAKFKRVFGNWGVFRIYPTSITGSKRFMDQISKDHLRILAAYAERDFRSRVVRTLFLKIPVYSVFRRARNAIFFAEWKFFYSLDFRA